MTLEQSLIPDEISAAELADIIGKQERTVYRLKERLGWAETEPKKVGSGKPKRFILVHSLDVETLETVKAHYLQTKSSEEYRTIFEGLSDAAIARGKAASDILFHWSLYSQEHGSGRLAHENFAKAYNRGEVEVNADTLKTKPRISYTTLYRWEKDYKEKGFVGLTGQYRKRKQNKIANQPELAEFIQGLILKRPSLTTKAIQIRQLIASKKVTEGRDWHVPSPSSIRRYIKPWVENNRALIALSTDPDGYNNYIRPLFSRDDTGRYPNDLWQLDSTPADVILQDGRFHLVAGIDVYTRRLKVIVAPQSNSESILTLLKHMIMDWGLPNDGGCVKTDQGADYKSNAVKMALKRLQVEQTISNAYSGWEKSFIERAFRTLNHSILEWMAEFCGHNVAERKRIEAVKSFAQRLAAKKRNGGEIIESSLTSYELQEIINQWVDMYHDKPHSGLNKKTPNQVYRESRYQKRVVDERQLVVCMNYAGSRSVTRGAIKLNNREYAAEEFQDPTTAYLEVDVHYDPENLGRVFCTPKGTDGTGQVIVAYDKELVGNEIDRAPFQKARAEGQRKLRGLLREHNSKAKSFDIKNLHKAPLEAAKQAKQNVTGFERAPVQATNPFGDIEAAIKRSAQTSEFKDTVEAKSISEMLAEQQREKEELRTQEAPIRERRQKVIRTEADLIQMLIYKELEEGLTEEEQMKVEDYMMSDVGEMQVKAWRQVATYEHAKRAKNG